MSVTLVHSPVAIHRNRWSQSPGTRSLVGRHMAIATQRDAKSCGRIIASIKSRTLSRLLTRWQLSIDQQVKVMRASSNAEDEVLMNTLKGAARLDVPSVFRPQFMLDAEREHPECFADLPPLK
jgi:hypothetical protein